MHRAKRMGGRAERQPSTAWPSARVGPTGRHANAARVESARMAIPETLERLLTTRGPSGQETAAADVWREAARTFGEVANDVLGSSWVRVPGTGGGPLLAIVGHIDEIALDRKSTRLNSSHMSISYAVFCL